MILYVNGDSHTAAAEAVNPHAFAEDDGDFFYMGRAPHPSNLQVSWGKQLSGLIKAGLKCDAESASSNTRILRTTREWLKTRPTNTEILMIIQWSTWERQEWLIDGVYYQVNASGIDDVPASWVPRYKKWITEIDWQQATEQAHGEIWLLHQELKDLSIPHVFFNGNSNFGSIAMDQRHDWGVNYVDPYDPKMTWDQWLRNNGYDTVSPKSYHFGPDAHAAWARFMLQYVVRNKLLT